MSQLRKKMRRTMATMVVKGKRMQHTMRDKKKGFNTLFDRYRKTPIYLALLLGAFSLIGATLLASGENLTLEAIKERKKEDLLASLEMVVPKNLYDNDLVHDSYEINDAKSGSRTIYPALRNGQVEAIAYEVTGQGYGGSILVLMGVDKTGTLLGVRVLQHAETPGLGDKVDAERSDWIKKFSGRSLTNTTQEGWAVKKDGGVFDQFSGATITPRGVVKAVKQGLDYFDAHKGQLLSPPEKSGATGAKS